jgi:hypothetical protein
MMFVPKLLSLSRRPAQLVLMALCSTLTAHAQTPIGLPFTESFDDNNLRDTAQTTASWNRNEGQLELPRANALAGTFSELTPAENLQGSYITRALAVGDLDGDGDLDLVEGVQGRSGVYLNSGGTFGPRAYSAPTSANTRSVAVADLDGDGDLDWVAGNAASVPPRWYRNDGNASFTVIDFGPKTHNTNDVAIADLNGDGRLDVVLATIGATRNRIYYNTGDPESLFGPGGSSTTFVSTVAEESREALAGDLDRDGDVDLVFLNYAQPSRVHLNGGVGADGAAIWTVGTTIGTDADASEGGALGDLNGDQFLDVVVANWEVGETSKVYLNNALASPDDPFAGVAAIEITTSGDPDFPREVELADADADGDLDIFLVSESHFFGTRLLLNDGTGMVFVRVDIDAGPAVVRDVTRDAAVGDFDGDGDLDLITGNQTFENGVHGPELNRLYRNAGTDTGGPPAVQLTAFATSREVDDTPATIDSVRLTATEDNVGAAFANEIEYWLSSDGGARWALARPGRPVGFASPGSQLKWRAYLRSLSPATASSLGLDSLTLVLNAGPTVTMPIGPQAATEGRLFSVTADIDDGDNPPDPLFYSLAGLPAGTGLSIDPATGEISGIPTTADVDASSAASGIDVIVTATDGGLSVQDPFLLTVGDALGTPPAFTSTPGLAATEGQPYVYDVTTMDPDAGETLTITAHLLPGWLMLTDNGDGTARLAGTPVTADVGDHDVELRVRDAVGATDVQIFTVIVANAAQMNSAPVFTSSPILSSTEAQAYSYLVATSDPDGDPLTIVANTLPAWLMLTDNGNGQAELTGTPNGAATGSHPVALETRDSFGASSVQQFTIDVAAAADGPVITMNGIAQMTVNQGATFTDPGATATDAQDGNLTSQIVVDNRVNTNVVGTYMVTYTVSDTAGHSSQAQRTVTVRAQDSGGGGGGDGGGGSTGLLDLFLLALGGVAGLARRRRL